MNKSKVIPLLKYVFLIGLGALLMFLAFKNIDFNEMKEELSHAKFSWVLLSMLLAVLSHISRAIRWNLLLKPIGYTPKIQNSIAAIFIAYFANIALPRFGEVARCTVLNRTDGIPIQKLIGTVIAERAFDLVCLIICLFITVFMNVEIFGGFFLKSIMTIVGKFEGLFKNSLLSIGVVLIMIIVLFILIKNLKKIIPTKFKSAIIGILDGVKSINKIEKKGQFISHTIFIWIMYFGMVYVCFFALDFTSNLTVADGFFILIAGGLGMSAPVQGGAGAYHIMVASALIILPNFMSDYSGGIIFATLVHTAQTILMLIMGSFALIWLFLKGFKLKDESNSK